MSQLKLKAGHMHWYEDSPSSNPSLLQRGCHILLDAVIDRHRDVGYLELLASDLLIQVHIPAMPAE
jgi:hypothetical protein